MIYVDAEFNGVMPERVTNARNVEDMFNQTGAHIVVSDKPFPPTGGFIKMHIDANSAFIYVSGYPNKDTEVAHKKMIEAGARSKYIIIPGNIINSDGDQSWHNMTNKGSYREHIEWVAHMMSSGVQVVNISAEYLDTFIQSLDDFCGRSYNFVPVEIKTYKPITDGSITLATVPAVGGIVAKAMYNSYREARKTEPKLIDMIAGYTNRKKCDKNLSTRTMCAGMREWFGIPEGWNISLVPEDMDSLDEG